MESTGKFLRPAQGDAVTAIDLMGRDSRPFCDDPAPPVDKRRSWRHINTLVGTSGHLFRGEDSFMRASDWCRLLGLVPPPRQVCMSASYRREGRGRVERYGDAAERPDLPRVARIAQAIAQKEPPAGHVA